MGSTPGRKACSRHIQCQPGPWRGSRDLGFPTFRPWPGSLHPHRRFKAFRHRPQAGGPGPPGRCLDRRAATLNPFPRHHRLCRITSPHHPQRQLPETAVLRVCRASSSTGGACSIRNPKPRQGQRPAPCSPWPVRHRDSGGSRPHSRHRSRPRCGRLPLCRHGARFPSHRPPATATGKPSPRPAGLPSPYRLTARIRPIDPPNRANFDSVSIRTANYQNSGIFRFDPESPFRTDAPAPNAGPGVAPHRPVSAPQTGGDSVSWTRTGTDTPQPWLGHATRYGTRGDNGRTA